MDGNSRRGPGPAPIPEFSIEGGLFWTAKELGVPLLPVTCFFEGEILKADRRVLQRKVKNNPLPASKSVLRNHIQHLPEVEAPQVTGSSCVYFYYSHVKAVFSAFVVFGKVRPYGGDGLDFRVRHSC